MKIKAKELPEPMPEVSGPTDRFDEGMEGFVEEMPPPPALEERRTSDLVLILLAVFLLAFIVTMIVIFCVKGSTPDTLIQCVLGAGGLEALLLAGIKISKVRAGKDTGSDPPDGMG